MTEVAVLPQRRTAAGLAAAAEAEAALWFDCCDGVGPLFAAVRQEGALEEGAV